MRFIIMLAAVAVLVAGGLMSKSSAIMSPKTSASFAERRMPVDQALNSGRFVVEERLDD